jgi:sterol desaturase/sphingolipid hydroxylase (fatty acid hydroxylase superfamily)
MLATPSSAQHRALVVFDGIQALTPAPPGFHGAERRSHRRHASSQTGRPRRSRLGPQEDEVEFLIENGPFLVLGACALLEAVAPGRAFPRQRWWRLRGVLYLALYFGIATLVPMTVDRWLGQFQLFDASGLGLWQGTLIGVLVLELISYAWHRALHRVPFLWRWFHQMHHSAERLDVYGAFLFHPFDVVGFSLMGSVALVLLVGLSPTAAGLANVLVFAAVVFGHTNVRTPRWLGYIVQRPENHAVHHQRGVHAFNYADFSLIDMLFGTFRNPQRWQAQAGFYDGGSARVGAMLIGRDISNPGALPDSRWASEAAQLGS